MFLSLSQHTHTHTHKHTHTRTARDFVSRLLHILKEDLTHSDGNSTWAALTLFNSESPTRRSRMGVAMLDPPPVDTTGSVAVVYRYVADAPMERHGDWKEKALWKEREDMIQDCLCTS